MASLSLSFGTTANAGGITKPAVRTKRHTAATIRSTKQASALSLISSNKKQHHHRLLVRASEAESKTQMSTVEKAGIKIVNSPSEAKLTELGVKSWPKNQAQILDAIEEPPVEPLALSLMPAKVPLSNFSETVSTFSLWTFSADAPNTSTQVHSPVPIDLFPMYDNKELPEIDGHQKEGSSTGSNTGSMCIDEDQEKKLDIEAPAPSLGILHDKEGKASLRTRKPDFLRHRTATANGNVGFVPYKR